MERFFDRLVALFLLALGLFSASGAILALNGLDGSGFFGPHGMSAGTLSLDLPAGLACLVGAWWFWSGRWPDRARRVALQALFGRNAESQKPAGSRFRRWFFIVPLIAIAALAADRLDLWPAPKDAGVEAAAPPADEPAPAPDKPAPQSTPDNAVAPQPPEKAAVPLPPAAEPAPAKSPPSEQAAAPESPATPPEVALLPAPPPQTVAPLPKPEPAPTGPDGHHDAIVWLSVSPDGHSILSASTDRVIKLWDIDGKRLIRDLGVHRDMARSALYLPDGKRALTAGDDGEIVLRRLADGAVLRVFSAGANGGVNKLAITLDGKRIVSVHEAGSVIVWGLESGAALHVLTGHDWPVTAVVVSPDGGRAVSGSIDGELRLWDINSGKLLRRWQGHERGTYGAVFTPDGHHVLTGSGDYTIKLWDLDTFREVRRFDGHSGTVYALALSGDGKRLLSASLDGTARLWDMETGDQLTMFDADSGPVYAAAFTADGSVLTGGIDRTIREWPAGGGDAVALFPGAPD